MRFSFVHAVDATKDDGTEYIEKYKTQIALNHESEHQKFQSRKTEKRISIVSNCLRVCMTDHLDQK